MRYTVGWKPAAANRLAELWTESDDRGAITAATDRIGRVRSINPEALGEERSGGARMLIDRPRRSNTR